MYLMYFQQTFMPKLIILLFSFLFVSLSGNYAQAFDFQENIESMILQSIEKEQPTSEKELSASSENETQIITFAKKYLGAPYKYSGTTPKGFDCSGFVSFVFNEFGVKLPHSSREMAKEGERVDKEDFQIGDLIFFEGRPHNGIVGHVGIVCDINGDNISFIHASTSSRVIISSVKEEYYAGRFLQVRRVKI